MLKHIPILIRLHSEDIRKADAAKELRIDRYSLEKELAHQPGVYAFWATMHSQAIAKVESLREQRDILESELYRGFMHDKVKPSAIKHYILRSSRHQRLSRRIRVWEGAERELKGLVRAFEQRHSSLMALNANTRNEQKHGS